MKYLIDTHFLVWLSMKSTRLHAGARELLSDPGNAIYFSAISIFEIAVKQQLSKQGFDVDATALRTAMIERNFIELPVNGLHAAFVSTLPLIHRDPFDRLLVAQATVEGITLITADELVGRYPGPILRI